MREKRERAGAGQRENQGEREGNKNASRAGEMRSPDLPCSVIIKNSKIGIT